MHFQAIHQELTVYFVCSMVFFFISFVIYGTSDYDYDKLEKNKTKIDVDKV